MLGGGDDDGVGFADVLVVAGALVDVGGCVGGADEGGDWPPDPLLSGCADEVPRPASVMRRPGGHSDWSGATKSSFGWPASAEFMKFFQMIAGHVPPNTVL